MDTTSCKKKINRFGYQWHNKSNIFAGALVNHILQPKCYRGCVSSHVFQLFSYGNKLLNFFLSHPLLLHLEHIFQKY